MRIEVNLLLYWILRIKGKTPASGGIGTLEGIQNIRPKRVVGRRPFPRYLAFVVLPIEDLDRALIREASGPAPATGLRNLSLGLSH